MPRIPPDQVSHFEADTEPAAAIAGARPKLRTRGELGAARAPPLVALLSGAQTARFLNVSTRTLSRWVVQGIFPKPVYLTPTSPAKWRVRDLENWIEKRAAARHPRPALRGALAHLEEAAS